MNLIPVNLATEDELSEVVLRRLVDHAGRYAIGTCYRRGGYGYLRRNAAGWNAAAKGVPFVLLTDLDTGSCPLELIESWLMPAPHPARSGPVSFPNPAARRRKARITTVAWAGSPLRFGRSRPLRSARRACPGQYLGSEASSPCGPMRLRGARCGELAVSGHDR